ncbi:MAG: elongation factor P-like protein YeiP [Xanthomonadales bacterium]|nr:elongation factor P-like protein YeiP [Xanthomonadales bacterium]
MRAADVKRGMVVEHEGRIWQVREVERSAPTARNSNVTFRFVLSGIPGGQKLDLSLRAEDELRELELARRPVQFSYRDGSDFVFLDAESFEPYVLDESLVGEAVGYLSEGLEGCHLRLLDERPVGLELPPSVVLEIVETPPELKGATATKRSKPARLATGIEVQVPEYLAVGDRIRVSTLTGEYLGRA